MIEVLKTFHFLSLWAAGGIGAGGWILQYVHAKSEVRPSLEVVQSLRLMGLLALISVIILWGTGLWMMALIYNGLPSIMAFHVKLLAAIFVLVGSLGTNLETLRSMRSGVPPRAQVMAVLAWLIRGALVAVLVSTAIAFA